MHYPGHSKDRSRSGQCGQLPRLFIAGMSALVGTDIRFANDAVADGLYPAEQSVRDGYSSLRISRADVPSMAVHACRRAMEETPLTVNDLSLITFSAVHDHGHPRLWQPAGYLQNVLECPQALAWNVNFGCNALAISTLQAAMILPTMGGLALICGSDKFEGTSFNRWTSDQGLAYGDAASAFVLSSSAGFAELLYLDVLYIPELEALHRFEYTYAGNSREWAVTEAKRNFFSANGGAGFFGPLNRALDRLEGNLLRFMNEHAIALKAVVTPFVGKSVRETTYDARFFPLAAVNAGAFGATVGHTGTSDQMVGLAHLMDDGQLAAGDRVLLIGAGAGFSLSAMILQIDNPPSHSLLGDA